MPYMREGNCVYHKNEDGSPGEVVKCHASAEEAQQHLEALYANVEEAKASPDGFAVVYGDTIKSLGGGKVGGYLVMYGNEAQRDLEGEYFTPETDFGLDWFDSRPVLYHHGLDKAIKGARIGKIESLKQDDMGVWIEAQLDLRNQYVAAILQLVEKGALGWSSGTLPHLIQRENGKITRWPIVEGSSTPTPAEPRLSVVPLKALLEVPRPEGLATAEPGSDDGAASDATKSGEPPAHSADAPAAEAQSQPAPLSTTENLAGGLPETAAPPADGSRKDPPSAKAEEDSRGDKAMDPKQVALAAVNATLQALNVNNVDEQKKMQLVDSILAHLQQSNNNGQNGQQPSPQGMMAADPAKFGEEAGKAALQVVQAYVAEQAAVKAAVPPVVTESKVADSVTPPPNIEVRTKYHDLNAEDMAFLASVRVAVYGKAWAPSIEFARELAAKTIKADAKGELPFMEIDPRDQTPYAIKAARLISSGAGLKDNEVINTGQSNFGAEWVPDIWSSELWRKVRGENRVLSLITVSDMPQDDWIIPLEGSDPTVYRVAQTTNDAQFNPASSPVASSKIGSANVTMSAKKLGARIAWSHEEDEDAIIRVVPEVRRKMLQAMEDAIEYDVLQADNTIAGSPSGNINRYDAATLAADGDHWLLGWDGIAHLPLVDATTLLVNQAAARPDITMLRGLRRKLATVYMTRLEDLVYIVEPVTGTYLLDMDGVQTIDKFGPNATLLKGQLAAIDSIPIVASYQFGQADDANGKLSNTPANNVFGRALLFFRPAFRFGYRRRVTMESVRFPLADASQLVSFCRVGFIRRDNTCASLAYNIGL